MGDEAPSQHPGYAPGAMALLSCPFCRTLYTKGEKQICPECGVELVALERLPLSLEAQAEEGARLVLPEHERLPWYFWGRGRGALLALSVLGIAAFFLPWVELTFPDHEFRTGFDLARGRAGWLWGGAVAWFVLLPLVGTRRTIAAMRGVRPIAALFSSMTAAEILMMTLMPPAARSGPAGLSWAWGLYVSASVSVLALLAAVRFGGSLPPLPRNLTHATESSETRTLH
ncbi:MAG TPA: hypothetical protein VGP93_07590 [Polyangiaceae bacterium]|nr:hypothetical protein [Polyangiaceae bacterium]